MAEEYSAATEMGLKVELDNLKRSSDKDSKTKLQQFLSTLASAGDSEMQKEYLARIHAENIAKQSGQEEIDRENLASSIKRDAKDLAFFMLSPEYEVKLGKAVTGSKDINSVSEEVFNQLGDPPQIEEIDVEIKVDTPEYKNQTLDDIQDVINKANTPDDDLASESSIDSDDDLEFSSELNSSDELNPISPVVAAAEELLSQQQQDQEQELAAAKKEPQQSVAQESTSTQTVQPSQTASAQVESKQNTTQPAATIDPSPIEFNKQNLYNQSNDPRYLLKREDMEAIAPKFLRDAGDEAKDVVVADVRSLDEIATGMALAKNDLDEGKTVVGIFNTQSAQNPNPEAKDEQGAPQIATGHWIAYKMYKENDEYKLAYKDSYGHQHQNLEDKFIEALYSDNSEQGKNAITRLEPGKYEQKDAVNCGIFALENMKVLAGADLTSTDTSPAFFDPSEKSQGYGQFLADYRKVLAVDYARERIERDLVSDIVLYDTPDATAEAMEGLAKDMIAGYGLSNITEILSAAPNDPVLEKLVAEVKGQDGFEQKILDAVNAGIAKKNQESQQSVNEQKKSASVAGQSQAETSAAAPAVQSQGKPPLSEKDIENYDQILSSNIDFSRNKIMDELKEISQSESGITEDIIEAKRTELLQSVGRLEAESASIISGYRQDRSITPEQQQMLNEKQSSFKKDSENGINNMFANQESVKAALGLYALAEMIRSATPLAASGVGSISYSQKDKLVNSLVAEMNLPESATNLAYDKLIAENPQVRTDVGMIDRLYGASTTSEYDRMRNLLQMRVKDEFWPKENDGKFDESRLTEQNIKQLADTVTKDMHVTQYMLNSPSWRKRDVKNLDIFYKEIGNELKNLDTEYVVQNQRDIANRLSIAIDTEREKLGGISDLPRLVLGRNLSYSVNLSSDRLKSAMENLPDRESIIAASNSFVADRRERELVARQSELQQQQEQAQEKAPLSAVMAELKQTVAQSKEVEQDQEAKSTIQDAAEFLKGDNLQAEPPAQTPQQAKAEVPPPPGRPPFNEQDLANYRSRAAKFLEGIRRNELDKMISNIKGGTAKSVVDGQPEFTRDNMRRRIKSLEVEDRNGLEGSLAWYQEKRELSDEQLATLIQTQEDLKAKYGAYSENAFKDVASAEKAIKQYSLQKTIEDSLGAGEDSRQISAELMREIKLPSKFRDAAYSHLINEGNKKLSEEAKQNEEIYSQVQEIFAMRISEARDSADGLNPDGAKKLADTISKDALVTFQLIDRGDVKNLTEEKSPAFYARLGEAMKDLDAGYVRENYKDIVKQLAGSLLTTDALTGRTSVETSDKKLDKALKQWEEKHKHTEKSAEFVRSKEQEAEIQAQQELLAKTGKTPLADEQEQSNDGRIYDSGEIRRLRQELIKEQIAVMRTAIAALGEQQREELGEQFKSGQIKDEDIKELLKTEAGRENITKIIINAAKDNQIKFDRTQAAHQELMKACNSHMSKVNWQDAVDGKSARSFKVMDGENELCELSETKYKQSLKILTPDGKTIDMKGFRIIDFPAQTSGATSLQMTALNSDGLNVTVERANKGYGLGVEYDDSGRPVSMTYQEPLIFVDTGMKDGKGNPIKVGCFEGKGQDAGQYFSLGITQDQYEGLQKAIMAGKGLGQEAKLAQGRSGDMAAAKKSDINQQHIDNPGSKNLEGVQEGSGLSTGSGNAGENIIDDSKEAGSTLPDTKEQVTEQAASRNKRKNPEPEVPGSDESRGEPSAKKAREEPPTDAPAPDDDGEHKKAGRVASIKAAYERHSNKNDDLKKVDHPASQATDIENKYKKNPTKKGFDDEGNPEPYHVTLEKSDFDVDGLNKDQQKKMLDDVMAKKIARIEKGMKANTQLQAVSQSLIPGLADGLNSGEASVDSEKNKQDIIQDVANKKKKAKGGTTINKIKPKGNAPGMPDGMDDPSRTGGGDTPGGKKGGKGPSM